MDGFAAAATSAFLWSVVSETRRRPATSVAAGPRATSIGKYDRKMVLLAHRNAITCASARTLRWQCCLYVDSGFCVRNQFRERMHMKKRCRIIQQQSVSCRHHRPSSESLRSTRPDTASSVLSPRAFSSGSDLREFSTTISMKTLFHPGHGSSTFTTDLLSLNLWEPTFQTSSHSFWTASLSLNHHL